MSYETTGCRQYTVVSRLSAAGPADTSRCPAGRRRPRRWRDRAPVTHEGMTAERRKHQTLTASLSESVCRAIDGGQSSPAFFSAGSGARWRGDQPVLPPISHIIRSTSECQLSGCPKFSLPSILCSAVPQFSSISLDRNVNSQLIF